MTYWEFDESGRRRLTGDGERLVGEAIASGPLGPLWRHSPKVARVALDRFRNDRAELHQAACMGLWKAALKHNPPACLDRELQAFLLFAARFVFGEVVDRLRQTLRPQPELRDYWSWYPDEKVGDPAENAVTRETASTVRNAVDQLPYEMAYEVKRRFGFENLPTRRDVFKQTTHKSLNRGMARLAQSLEGHR